MPTIVVTCRLPDEALALLRASGDVVTATQLPDDELRLAVSGADALVTSVADRIDATVLEAAGDQLRCVANVAVGYDNIDVEAATRRGIVVTNTPDVLTDATADLTMALILAITRRIGEGERLLRAPRPWAWSMDFMLGTSLAGKTLGIVGLGAIGRATAMRGRAFGMNIMYTGRRRATRKVEVGLGDAEYVPLEELLSSADVVSLHCPLTPATRHLIDAPNLERMRSTAYLVNTGRGPLVDEGALARALRARSIAGAALDVFENEPEVHQDLLDLENVVIVPHLGSATTETRSAMADLAARNALSVLAGRQARNPVNPEAMRRP
jgi:glyoxylate reductase